MSKLWLRLTPFSSDSSGFLSVLYGLDALVLSFDPQGCINNYAHIDEPRWQNKKQRFFSARITERELILGKEDILVEQAVKLIEQEKPNFFVLMGGPISSIIGSDLNALAAEVEAETGVKSMGADLKSQDFYDAGASFAMLTLGKFFLKPSSITLKNSVNILGATIFEFPASRDYENLIKLVSEDYEILSVWGISSKLDNLKKATAVELNLVVSVSGLALAKWMEKNFGIPYKIFFPIGGLKSNDKEKIIRPTDLAINKKLLIVGEQVMVNGLRDYLKREYGFKNVWVSSFFMMEESLMEPEDRRISAETDLEELLIKGEYDFLIGDPLLERLIGENSQTKLIPLSHLPVSGQFFLEERVNLLDEEINSWVLKHLKKAETS